LPTRIVMSAFGLMAPPPSAVTTPFKETVSPFVDIAPTDRLLLNAPWR
jgi:hypothetical protein